MSVATNGLLFTDDAEDESGAFSTNPNVRELLHAMKNKYRLFLITQVDKEGSAQHEAAKLEM